MHTSHAMGVNLSDMYVLQSLVGSVGSYGEGNFQNSPIFSPLEMTSIPKSEIARQGTKGRGPKGTSEPTGQLFGPKWPVGPSTT